MNFARLRLAARRPISSRPPGSPFASSPPRRAPGAAGGRARAPRW